VPWLPREERDKCGLSEQQQQKEGVCSTPWEGGLFLKEGQSLPSAVFEGTWNFERVTGWPLHFSNTLFLQPLAFPLSAELSSQSTAHVLPAPGLTGSHSAPHIT
jgi:hypothetical protein